MLGSDARVVEESWYESIVANLRDDAINTRVQAWCVYISQIVIIIIIISTSSLSLITIITLSLALSLSLSLSLCLRIFLSHHKCMQSSPFLFIRIVCHHIVRRQCFRFERCDREEAVFRKLWNGNTVSRVIDRLTGAVYDFRLVAW